MKTLRNLLLCVVSLLAVGCLDDDTPKDVVGEICVFVSAETGVMYDLFDSNQEYPIECMLVMTEDNPGVWEPLRFGAIDGFTYERGHEYYLRVVRTIIANPPADAPDRTYSLKSIIEDRLIAEPEVPIEPEVKSEEDIEYQELCPFDKYSIYPRYVVDAEANIYSAEGGIVPPYDVARIYLKNVLHQADPNWVVFQKVAYQATYSYVISPLADEIRLVRNETSGPMFKNVIPNEEFTYITEKMDAGTELCYTIILANVHKKGLQKLELIIKKI